MESLYLYWDSSAILFALLTDAHSQLTLKWVRKEGLHLLPSLVYAEVVAVLDRMVNERILTRVPAQSALETLLAGPWRFLNLCPDKEQMDRLQGKYLLRGADF
jgi:predicted nucleic acid-binding protein